MPPRAGRRQTRRALLLVGLLGLLAACFFLGSRLAGAFALFQGGREPTPPGAATGTVTAIPSPQVSPSPSGLADFPVSGEIAVVQWQNGTNRLFLLDAASGETRALPGVPNVDSREIVAPQWSPGGDRLAWIARYNGKPHVVVMALDESEPYQLPAGEAWNRLSAPAFLPGGRQVSFWASNGAGSLLVIADAVTGETVEEIRLPAYRNLFAWNWAGDLVAFVYQGSGPYQVGVSRSPGGEGRALDTGGESYAPAWSNDGQWIAFQSDAGRDPGMNEIWVARADGSEARAVTSTPAGAWSRAPTWSPDGRRIAFVSDRSGSRGADFGELFVVDLETGDTRQMTETGGNVYDWRPAWRP
jgi:Tol biopolymer transport system component